MMRKEQLQQYQNAMRKCDVVTKSPKETCCPKALAGKCDKDKCLAHAVPAPYFVL